MHSKYLSTREQLELKCKQAELLDASNFDLEQELAIQRRENDKNRQQIKEFVDVNHSKMSILIFQFSRLFDLCDKTRRQCHDIEHQYETFRTKQLSSYFDQKQTNSSTIFSTPVSNKRQRSNSYSMKPFPDTPSFATPNLFDVSSTSIFKSHLSELKSRIRSLTIECSTLNEQLNQSDQDKYYLIDRINQLERQRRDDNDSLQNELNYYRKLMSKYHNDNTKSILSNIYSPPEHDLSLYDEVLLENQSNKPSYEPTNYKELFARVYEKLKTK